MRTLLFTVLTCLFLHAEARAQSAELLMDQLPPVPTINCAGVSADAVNDFTARIDTVTARIEAALNRIRIAENVRTESMGKTAVQAAGQQMGLSQSQINRLQQGGTLSEAEADRLADQMVRRQTDMSVEEMQKLASMSEAEQQQWARNHAVQMQQKVQANPSKYESGNNKAAMLYDLMQKRQRISDDITALLTELTNTRTSIENDPEGLRLMDEIERLQHEQAQYGGEVSRQEAAAARAIHAKLEATKRIYCERMTPLWLGYIGHYADKVPAMKRLSLDVIRLTNQMTEIELGIKDSVTTEAVGYQVAEGYANVLRTAFRYTY